APRPRRVRVAQGGMRGGRTASQDLLARSRPRRRGWRHFAHRLLRVIAEDRFGYASRQRARPLDQPDHWHHDEEEGEIIEGADAPKDEIGALGRLRAEMAECYAGDYERPEEPSVDRPVARGPHLGAIEPRHEEKNRDRREQ